MIRMNPKEKLTKIECDSCHKILEINQGLEFMSEARSLGWIIYGGTTGTRDWNHICPQCINSMKKKGF